MENIKQDEMLELAIGLQERGIEFEIFSFRDGLQIRCIDWDAICNDMSYGHEDGLLEVLGLPQCNGDVLGWLTAKEVLEMVDNKYTYRPEADIEE